MTNKRIIAGFVFILLVHMGVVNAQTDTLRVLSYSVLYIGDTPQALRIPCYSIRSTPHIQAGMLIAPIPTSLKPIILLRYFMTNRNWRLQASSALIPI